MILIIDLSREPKLVLMDKKREVDNFEWEGLYQLSETLLLNIDRFLKKNKVKLKEVKKIKVVESKESMVSNQIAKAVALGLKTELDE